MTSSETQEVCLQQKVFRKDNAVQQKIDVAVCVKNVMTVMKEFR